MILVLESLESGRGALVDAGTAVDALGGIDDSDVVAGDGTLGAHIVDNLTIEDGKTL